MKNKMSLVNLSVKEEKIKEKKVSFPGDSDAQYLKPSLRPPSKNESNAKKRLEERFIGPHELSKLFPNMLDNDESPAELPSQLVDELNKGRLWETHALVYIPKTTPHGLVKVMEGMLAEDSKAELGSQRFSNELPQSGKWILVPLNIGIERTTKSKTHHSGASIIYTTPKDQLSTNKSKGGPEYVHLTAFESMMALVVLSKARPGQIPKQTLLTSTPKSVPRSHGGTGFGAYINISQQVVITFTSNPDTIGVKFQSKDENAPQEGTQQLPVAITIASEEAAINVPEGLKLKFPHEFKMYDGSVVTAYGKSQLDALLVKYDEEKAAAEKKKEAVPIQRKDGEPLSRKEQADEFVAEYQAEEADLKQKEKDNTDEISRSDARIKELEVEVAKKPKRAQEETKVQKSLRELAKKRAALEAELAEHIQKKESSAKPKTPKAKAKKEKPVPKSNDEKIKKLKNEILILKTRITNLEGRKKFHLTGKLKEQLTVKEASLKTLTEPKPDPTKASPPDIPKPKKETIEEKIKSIQGGIRTVESEIQFAQKQVEKEKIKEQNAEKSRIHNLKAELEVLRGKLPELQLVAERISHAKYKALAKMLKSVSLKYASHPILKDKKPEIPKAIAALEKRNAEFDQRISATNEEFEHKQKDRIDELKTRFGDEESSDEFKDAQADINSQLQHQRKAAIENIEKQKRENKNIIASLGRLQSQI